MLNSQKFLIFLFILSFGLGTIKSAYSNISPGATQLNATANAHDSDYTNLQGMKASPTNQNAIYETNWWDAIRLGGFATNVLLSGLNPASFMFDDYQQSANPNWNTLSYWIRLILTLFRVIITLICALELYMLFVNKKNA